MTTDPAAQNPSARAHRSHQNLIVDQFSRQAELFAQSPALHNEGALSLLVEAAKPRPSDLTLDVACGPGSVVVAFSRVAKKSAGLDATPAMLREGEKLAAANNIANAEWHHGDVYALPFPDDAFDIVSCRFAFHHLREPARAFAEMVRVCRVGGRIALCDGIASGDPKKPLRSTAWSCIAIRPRSNSARSAGISRYLKPPDCPRLQRISIRCRRSGSG